MGQPVVQIGFEAKGDTWTLRKRFSGTSGQVTLQSENSGRPLTGPAAEDVLAELLGVGEIIGSRQAGTVLPSRWAHLWVRQGLSGEDLLATGKSHYDFDQLRLQLERSGGAAVQQSALDQRVEQRIEDALAENFTSRGTKKNSPLHAREEALKAAQSRMELTLARLTDYEDASEQLADLCEELKLLQVQELPALVERQKRLQDGAEAAGRLDAAIALAGKAFEPIRLRHEAAQQALQQLDGLQAEIEQRQQTLTTLEASAAGAQSREAELQVAEQQRRQSLDALGQQRQNLEQRQELLQRLLERTSKAESLTRQSAELEKLRQDSTRRQSLEQQLESLPSISKPLLQELRQLEQELRDAQTRQDAMAAGVKLLKADQPVRLDGRPLQVGEEQRLSAVFQLQVGDGVVAENSNSPAEVLSLLAKDPDKHVRRAVVGNDQSTAKLPSLLARDPHKDDCSAVVANSNTPKAVVVIKPRVAIIVQICEDGCKGSEPSPGRRFLFTLPQCHANILAKNFRSRSWLERFAIAGNPSTPEPVLERMAQEGNQLVRRAASDNLARRASALNQQTSQKIPTP